MVYRANLGQVLDLKRGGLVSAPSGLDKRVWRWQENKKVDLTELRSRDRATTTNIQGDGQSERSTLLRSSEKLHILRTTRTPICVELLVVRTHFIANSASRLLENGLLGTLDQVQVP